MASALMALARGCFSESGNALTFFDFPGLGVGTALSGLQIFRHVGRVSRDLNGLSQSEPLIAGYHASVRNARCAAAFIRGQQAGFNPVEKKPKLSALPRSLIP